MLNTIQGKQHSNWPQETATSIQYWIGWVGSVTWRVGLGEVMKNRPAAYFVAFVKPMFSFVSRLHGGTKKENECQY